MKSSSYNSYIGFSKKEIMKRTKSHQLILKEIIESKFTYWCLFPPYLPHRHIPTLLCYQLL